MEGPPATAAAVAVAAAVGRAGLTGSHWLVCQQHALAGVLAVRGAAAAAPAGGQTAASARAGRARSHGRGHGRASNDALPLIGWQQLVDVPAQKGWMIRWQWCVQPQKCATVPVAAVSTTSSLSDVRLTEGRAGSSQLSASGWQPLVVVPTQDECRVCWRWCVRSQIHATVPIVAVSTTPGLSDVRPTEEWTGSS